MNIFDVHFSTLNTFTHFHLERNRLLYLSNELRSGRSDVVGGHHLLTSIDHIGDELTRPDVVETFEIETDVFHQLAKIETLDNPRRFLTVKQIKV